MFLTKRTSFIFVCVLSLLMSTSAVFAAVPGTASAIDEKTELSLSLSDDAVAVGDTFMLTVSMKSGTNAPSVRVNALSVPGLQVFEQSGISNQTQVKLINGVSAVIAVSTYRLTAEQPGDYTIGPVTYQSRGTSTITSNSVVLHVTEKNTGLFNHVKKDTSSGNSNTNDVYDASESSFFSMYKNNITNFLLWLVLLVTLGLSIFFYFKRDGTDDYSQKVDIDTSSDNHRTEQVLHNSDHVTQQPEDSQKTRNAVFAEEELKKLEGKHLYVYTYERSKELLQKLQTQDSTASTDAIQALRNILKMSTQAKFAPEDKNQRQRIINLAKQINHYYEQ